MSRAAAGRRTGPPTSTTWIRRWVERPVPDLGRAAPEVPDRAHRALPGRLSADALRGRARHRLRPRALLLAPRGRARSAAARQQRRRRPITSDPPRHRLARMVLLPPFTPQAIDKLDPQGARDLQRADRRASSARAAATPPSTTPSTSRCKVIAHMLGIPESDGDRFRGWIKDVLEDGITDEAALMQRLRRRSREYFTAHLIERRKKPGDDLISYLTPADLPGRAPVHRQPRAGHACGCCWSPASTPPGAASARASGTWPRRPRTAAGWSPSRR